MIRAKSSSTFLECAKRRRAKILLEATGSVIRATSKLNSAFGPIGHQADCSKQKSCVDPKRRGFIHAIGSWVLQRAMRRIQPRSPGRIGAFVALLSNSALADRDPAECIAAHTGAQEAADAGRLSEARKLFDSCAAGDCPKVIQRDCKVMGRAVEKAIPTVGISAVDHNGQALTNYTIELDGVALPPDSTQQPIAVDPGNHRVKLNQSGHEVADLTITVRDKEKHQRIAIQLAPPDPVASRVRNAGYVLGAVGVVAFTSFVGFATSGYLDQRKLDSESSSSDPRNDYGLADRMRRKYVLADVSLGIGLVSFGVATYLLLVTRHAPEPTLPGTKTSLYVDGSPGFGYIGLRGAF